MRKTNEVKRFARWCFSTLGLRPIPIHMIYRPSLIDPEDNYCFGCYAYGDEDKVINGEIFLAMRLPKLNVLLITAHEIWHYYQNSSGVIGRMTNEECEREAESESDKLLGMWLTRGGYTAIEDESGAAKKDKRLRGGRKNDCVE